MTKFKTTLKQIYEFTPCEGEERLKELGLTEPDDREVTLKQVYDKYGLYDAIWCLCAVEGSERESQLLALFCAKQVKHLMTDERSVRAVEVTERFLFGRASKEEMKTADWVAWVAWVACSNAADAAAEAADAALATEVALAGESAYWAARAATFDSTGVKDAIKKAFLDMLDDPSSIERAVLEMNDD